MDRELYTAEHEAFRDVVRRFVDRQVVPNLMRWDEERLIDRDTWLVAGQQGIVGLSGPVEYGGGVTDYRYRHLVQEEFGRVGASALASSFALQDDIVVPYFVSLATPEQSRRWLPGMCRGELIGAIAMTEPGTGSDLRGIRTSATKVEGGWLVNGTKTFITSGSRADLVVVVTRTSDEGDAFSLLVVEEGMPGFARGRKLSKIGMHAQDTAELFFSDVFVPDENLLGVEGGALRQLMAHLPLERLSIASAAISAADGAFAWALEYVKERHAFGRRIADFQNTQFVVAEVATELDVTRAYVDRCVLAVSDGRLTAVEAAKAKWWATDVQNRVTDRLLQLFGGYGYMTEYPISRAWADARVQKIYGGTNEIMKHIIAREIVGNQ
jgi:long-chain-acyl-CoA dehydrogenase